MQDRTACRFCEVCRLYWTGPSAANDVDVETVSYGGGAVKSEILSVKASVMIAIIIRRGELMEK
jgi:hypothetical protein